VSVLQILFMSEPGITVSVFLSVFIITIGWAPGDCQEIQEDYQGMHEATTENSGVTKEILGTIIKYLGIIKNTYNHQKPKHLESAREYQTAFEGYNLKIPKNTWRWLNNKDYLRTI